MISCRNGRWLEDVCDCALNPILHAGLGVSHPRLLQEGEALPLVGG